MSGNHQDAQGGLRAILLHAFEAEPTRVHYIGGGSINQAARVEIRGLTYFVKWKHDAPRGFFQAEARGLELLQTAQAIQVPEVIKFEAAQDNRPAYLILEWIPESRQIEPLTFAVNFGRALAQLHRITGAGYGLDHDNFIGELPQSNLPMQSSWVAFYGDFRLKPQIDLAKQRGRLNPEREKLLMKLLERLDQIIGSGSHAPSLLHGDLWSGNFLVTAGNQPVVVDPAVYYGDREVEIAFTELFGGFPPGFLMAYREAYPLTHGYEYRRPLYHLYPLLVHLNLFGEMYGPRVDAICQNYLG